MKKLKLITCIILCISLAGAIIVPAYSFAIDAAVNSPSASPSTSPSSSPSTSSSDSSNITSKPHVVEKGISWVIMSLCNYAVKELFNPYRISIDSMVRQKTGKDAENLAGEGYNITTVQVENNKIKGIFSDVTSKLYPKLLMLAVVVFLVGLIYIGILTLLSSASGKKEEYMQRLTTWCTGLLLLFAFSLVMVFLIKVNNTLANVFLDIGASITPASSSTNGSTATGGSSTTTTTTGTGGNTQTSTNSNSKVLDKCQELSGSVNLLNCINSVRDKTTDIMDGDNVGNFHFYNDAGKTADVVVRQCVPRNFDSNWNGDKDAKGFIFSSEGHGVITKESDLTPTTTVTDYDNIPEDAVLDNLGYYVTVTNSDKQTYAQLYYLRAKTSNNLPLKDGDKTKFFLANSPLTTGDFYGINGKNSQAGGWWDSGMSRQVSLFLTVYTDPEAMNNLANAADDIEVGTPPNDPLLLQLYNLYYNPENVGRLWYAVLYLMGVIQVIMFLITYIMRTFMIAFLIIIFPVVMAIDCLNKVNDNKSATFYRWLKEYVAQVFTNSIHALSYAAMLAIILNKSDVGPIVKVIALWFILPSGKLLKTIFDIQPKLSTDDHGVAALAGGYALGSSLLGGLQKGFGGGSRGGSGGGSGGSGGSGGGSGDGSGDGGSGGGITGGSLLGRAVKGIGRGLGSVASTGAVLGTAAVGGAIGFAKEAAAGNDFGKIAQSTIAGAGVGAGVASLGMGVVGKASNIAKDGYSYAKDVGAWYDTRSSVSNASDSLRNIAAAGGRFKYELGKDGTRVFEQRRIDPSMINPNSANYNAGMVADFKRRGLWADSSGNVYSIQRADPNNAQAVANLDRQGLMVDTQGNVSRKARISGAPGDANYDSERQRLGGQGFIIDNDGYIQNGATGGYVADGYVLENAIYSEEPTITLSGDNSKQLGGMDKVSYEVGFDADGNIDASSIKTDRSVIREQIDSEFLYQNQYAAEETKRFRNYSGISLDHTVLGENELINNEHTYNRVIENLKTQLDGNRITQEQHSQAMSSVEHLYKYSSDLEHKKNDKIMEYNNVAGDVRNNLMSRPELRPFFNTENV